jgi:hypothetical protein
MSRPPPQQPKKDNIRTTYHPHSKRKTVVESFEEYGTGTGRPPHQRAHHPKPWLPFHSKSEFALAELILNSSLSSSQVDCLIKVVQTLIHDGEPFMVRDHCELKTLWEAASDTLAPVHFWSYACQSISRIPHSSWLRILLSRTWQGQGPSSSGPGL